ncbi:MAG: transporter [Rickettsiales bacterium]|jgi:hypothetical protein|nr:transporter [Rickettsiales bacterium]
MRKISLLAVAVATFASSMASAQTMGGTASRSGAPARNLENPLYNPAAGRFYSKTNYNMAPVKDYDSSMSLTEEFGYGITDRWTVSASIGYGWMDEALNLGGDGSGISNLGLGVLYKPVDSNGFVWTVKSGFMLDTGDRLVDQYPIGLPIADMGKDDDTFNLSTMAGYEFDGGFALAAELGYMLDLGTDKDYADYKYGDTSLYFLNLAGQFDLGRYWSLNLAYRHQGMTHKFLGQKAIDTDDIVLGANWQATDSTLLTVYADYDATSGSDRSYMVARSSADGDDNRWSFGLRAGVQF